MAEKTYSLQEVADMHLPPQWTDGVRWLQRRIAKGELRGVRFGRSGWRMRDSDIDYMLNHYSNSGQRVDTPQPRAASVADGLSSRSRRRLRSA